MSDDEIIKMKTEAADCKSKHTVKPQPKSLLVQKMTSVFLGLLAATFLVSTIAVGASYSSLRQENAQLKDRLVNFTLETEALQVQVQSLTEQRAQMNSSHYLSVKELEDQLEAAKRDIATCPDGWTKFGFRCFRLSSKEKAWEDSGPQCQRQGAELVILNDLRKLTFLNQLKSSFWIGLSGSGGVWTWRDGSSVPSSFWSSVGQSAPPVPPYRRYTVIKRQCAAFNPSSTMRLIEFDDCHTHLPYVCEKEAL